MKRRLIFASALSCALVTAASTASAQSCDQLLGSQTYRCDIKTDLGTQFEDCLSFSTPGVSVPIDLTVEGAGPGAFFACACQPAGRFGNPDFGGSPKFQCVGATSDPVLLSFASGRVRSSGFKLTATNDLGTTFSGRCRPDNTCSLVGVAQSFEEASSGWSTDR